MSEAEAICDLIKRYETAVEVHIEVYGRQPTMIVNRLKSLKHRLLKLKGETNEKNANKQ